MTEARADQRGAPGRRVEEGEPKEARKELDKGKPEEAVQGRVEDVQKTSKPRAKEASLVFYNNY